MTRTDYREQLADLRADVVEMGDAVLERLRQTRAALDRLDGDLAAAVVRGDHEINETYLDLEADCVDLFALQQPVAGDLRFVAASFKIITDLERIADLAANVAGHVADADPDRAYLPDVSLVDLLDLATEMVEDAVTAYATEDAAACHAVAERDDELDGLCGRVGQRVVRDLVETDRDKSDVETLLPEVYRLLLTVRDVERIGDHAVNVAARTLYMVESDDGLLY